MARKPPGPPPLMLPPVNLTAMGGSDQEKQANMITARQAPLQSYFSLPADAVTADPWLRALQINIGAQQKGGQVWVLSAGPNGIIETPFASAPSAPPSGDDVAAPLP